MEMVMETVHINMRLNYFHDFHFIGSGYGYGFHGGDGLGNGMGYGNSEGEGWGDGEEDVGNCGGCGNMEW
jgi:hypothetical protein